ncbi:MAG TPA: dicarboxylate/amino acid:cation symporter [Haliangium sp.]|nr:dicarboxylate/amino acid:cation symporter [Haliangium sp.]
MHDTATHDAATRHRHRLAFWSWELHWQALLGVTAGVILGWASGHAVAPGTGGISGRWDMQIYALIGDLFMSALQMLVVPLVMSAIVSSMASLGRMQGFARLGGKTLLFYMGTGLIAILTGLALVNVIAPGQGSGLTAAEVAAAVSTEGSAEASRMAELTEKTQGHGVASVLGVFRALIPDNVVEAMAGAQMLGLITFSLLFGVFVTRLEGKHREVMLAFWEGLYQVMIAMTFLVLRFLPLGVACLIARTAAETFASGNALERLTQLGLFALTTIAALALHALVTLPLVLMLIARVNPLRHYRAMLPALLTAFSTTSSAATLPMTIQCVEQRAGVSRRVSSFVLPLGASVNTDGTALYECVAVMFLAQLSGISLDFGTQLLIVLLALLTSIGVAGIPAASLVAIVVILQAVNHNLPAGQAIPVEALAIILVFDRLLDMCRTMVNVLGDSAAAVVVACSEGEREVLATDPGPRQAALHAGQP